MPGASTIASLSGYQPARFVRVRDGRLFMFDGVQRGWVWDGVASFSFNAGIDPPTAGPAMLTVPGGAATAGPYLCAYRYLDGSLGTLRFPSGIPSNLSPQTVVNALDGQGFQWSGFTATAQTARVKHVEMYRSTSAEATVLYLVARIGAWGAITSGTDAGGNVIYTVPSGHNLIVGAVITVSGTSVPGYNTVQTVTAVTATTVTTTASYSADSTSGGWFLSGYDEPLFLAGTIATVTDSSGTALYATSAAHGLEPGAVITVAGVLSAADALIPGYNGLATVATVPTSTELTLTIAGSGVAYSAAGNSGTWALTSYIGPPPSGAVGAGLITATVNDGNGFTQYTTAAGHGLFPGSLVRIQGTSVPDYNAVQQVTAAPSTTTFVTGQAYEADILPGYSTGTVTTNATATLVGSGTSWTQAMVGQQITISGEYYPFTITAVYSATQLTLSQAALTSSGGLSYAIAAGFWWLASLDDNTLGGLAQLLLLLADGTVNANRFVPPPNNLPYAVWFQDRLLMAGSVNYSAGTVATNGTVTVTGTSTNWNSGMGDGNREIIIAGEPAPIQIIAASASSLTLATATVNTGSGLAYVIRNVPELRNQLMYSESDEPESMQPQNVITVQENTGDDDEITGLIRHGAHVYVLKDRHLLAVQFIRQPNIDAQVYLVADRGAVSDRCCAWQDGLVYILDQKGVYMFNGVVTQEMATPIADLWYNQLLDFANSQWWFAVSDVQRRLIFFYVGFKADNSTRPRRALVLHTDSGAWTIDNHVWEVGGGAIVPYQGEARVFLGKENDTICMAGQALTDIVPACLTGTATSSTSNSLTDSGASFTDAVLDAPLAITAGTGKGQWARISTRTSTKLTIVGTWATQPDATSVYAVGAIQWSHQSGMMEYPVSDEKSKRSVNVYWKPTTNPATLDLWVYDDYATSPVVMQVPQTIRPGLTTTAGSPDIVLDMALNRSPLGPAKGYNEYYYGGLLEDRAQDNRYQTIGLRGFQTLDPVRIYQYEIQGVGEEASKR